MLLIAQLLAMVAQVYAQILQEFVIATTQLQLTQFAIRIAGR